MNLVHQSGDRLVVTSLEISNHFGRRHDNVMEAIRKIECSPEFARLNFKACTYTDGNQRQRPMYEITRDGFTFLCMGFTGHQAAVWKERYIAAFNQMEKALLNAKSAIVPMPRHASHGVCRITRRIERQVFELFVSGLRPKQVSEQLGLSLAAVSLLLHAKYQFSPAAGAPECSPELIAAVATRHLEVERQKMLEAQERVAQKFLCDANNQQLAQALDVVARNLLPGGAI